MRENLCGWHDGIQEERVQGAPAYAREPLFPPRLGQDAIKAKELAEIAQIPTHFRVSPERNKPVS